ncbi:hypothetical protein JQS43_24385 [Natronosporangium hydrolyticum]|uniref:Uncharacterized protein n=1 Tax=Natronosporangium hydrolyticum TaxID=2811111 RepID=A0A895YGP8_9ACTN|nr:hypothetical protein [Natronosporangium hydrolyticum]QSB14573.1 hypothetical protein JQS43_24385 [Natronosporangium hydrolyticum]
MSDLRGTDTPRPGDHLIFLKTLTVIRVIEVRLLHPDPPPTDSMWAVKAEIVQASKRRSVGRVETWHLRPEEFARVPEEVR